MWEDVSDLTGFRLDRDIRALIGTIDEGNSIVGIVLPTAVEKFGGIGESAEYVCRSVDCVLHGNNADRFGHVHLNPIVVHDSDSVAIS